MLTLIRLYSFGTAEAGGVYGKLYLNGQFICHTLENRNKAIPTGIYDLQNSKSPKFKRELPLIYDCCEVPAKRGIRIHSGNTFKDSSGCVLVGMGFNEKTHALTESAPAEAMATMICRNVKQLVVTSVAPLP